MLFYSQASNFLNFVHALLPFFISSKSFFFALVFVFAPSSCLILSLSMRLCCVSFENCSMANEKCTRRKGKKRVSTPHNSSGEEKREFFLMFAFSLFFSLPSAFCEMKPNHFIPFISFVRSLVHLHIRSLL